MQMIRLVGEHPVYNEQWHCQEHFEANMDVWRGCFSVKQTGENNRDSNLVNKADCGGAVPQFLFPENPKPVYIFGHLHCHE